MGIQRFNRAYREEQLKEIDDTVWDLVVIGGGITGAAVARDSALRGLRTLLLEADDFASGTSSGSSKLLHGGLRYLEQLEFKLVRDAIHERELLKKLYAPLVQDLDFVFPTYEGQFPPRWQLNLGLHLYDAFSGFRVRHRNLNRDLTLQNYPQLLSENITGACVYTDSFAEDYRLVIEIIKAAHSASAVCLSRMKVEHLHAHSTGCELKALDRLNSKVHHIRSKAIVNASGPFSDQVRSCLNIEPTLELTQGVHFVMPKEKLPISSAFVMSDQKLHRILFAIPWRTTVYFGTTDTRVSSVEDARASTADFEYCVGILKKHFRVPIERKDIIQSWAAVRPLIRPKRELSPSEISREHVIEENPKRIFHILGGKLTSHRLMAEEVLNQMNEYFSTAKCQTHIEPLLKGTSHLELDKIQDQVEYAIEYEMALTPLDFMRRRTSLYYEAPSLENAEAIAKIFRDQSNWQHGIDEIQKSLHWDQFGF